MGLFDFFKKKQNEEAVENNVVENTLSETLEETKDIDTKAVEEEAIKELEETAKEIISESIEEKAEEKIEDFAKEVISEAEEKIEASKENAEEFVEVAEEASEKIAEEIEEEAKKIEETVAVEEEKPVKKGFFARLKEGLGKTRNSIMGGVDSVLNAFTKIDEDLFEELEEVLIMADLGVDTTMTIIDALRKRVKKEGVTDPAMIKDMLSEEISKILLEGCDDDYEIEKPCVMLVIGVNGVGKTTTIGKLAHIYKEKGNSVMLAAADTFRAAAIDQLEIWGNRAGIEVIKHEENSDPAAVVFDAVNAAKARKTDILICDTAGRLHNKKNLMDELKKIFRVIEREYPDCHREVYLVLDATTGQNAMQQAKIFKEAADITGIILTKLDGTAKGGIVVAIKNELKIPVRYIGVGEGIEDLQKFDAHSFAKAIFGNE